MNKLLEKIAWKTRRWNYTFHLFDMYLHDAQEAWGINFFSIGANMRHWSLFAFEFRLPNKTHVKRFTIDHWDIFFLRNLLWKQYDSLSDRALWNSRSITAWDYFKLEILKRLF